MVPEVLHALVAVRCLRASGEGLIGHLIPPLLRDIEGQRIAPIGHWLGLAGRKLGLWIVGTVGRWLSPPQACQPPPARQYWAKGQGQGRGGYEDVRRHRGGEQGYDRRQHRENRKSRKGPPASAGDEPLPLVRTRPSPIGQLVLNVAAPFRVPCPPGGALFLKPPPVGLLSGLPRGLLTLQPSPTGFLDARYPFVVELTV